MPIGGLRIEGYVIVSSDGMLADAQRHMPASLQIPGDQAFFNHALDEVDLIVHGRHSYEGHANSPHRRRIIVTRRVQTIAPDPDNPRAVLWNPQGARFVTACSMAGIARGRVAVIGGPDVFAMFLDDFDVFYLSEAPRVTLAGGTRAIADHENRHPSEILSAHGLRATERRVLDDDHGVTLTIWRRSGDDDAG